MRATGTALYDRFRLIVIYLVLRQARSSSEAAEEVAAECVGDVLEDLSSRAMPAATTKPCGQIWVIWCDNLLPEDEMELQDDYDVVIPAFETNLNKSIALALHANPPRRIIDMRRRCRCRRQPAKK